MVSAPGPTVQSDHSQYSWRLKAYPQPDFPQLNDRSNQSMHQPSGIRKNSHSRFPRPDRILRSNVTASIEQQLENSTSSIFQGPRSEPATESNPKDLGNLSEPRAFNVAAGSEEFESGAEGHPFVVPDIPPRRNFSTPDLKIWPSQDVQTGEGSHRASSEHLSPPQPGYGSLPSAMSAFGQVLQQAPLSHFAQEQDYYAALYANTAVDYSSGLYAFQSPESIPIQAHRNSSPPVSHQHQSHASSRAPSPSSLRQPSSPSGLSKRSSRTQSLNQTEGSLSYPQAQQPAPMPLNPAETAKSRQQSSPYLNPGYFMDEHEVNTGSSNASTISSDAGSYYSTSLPGQMATQPANYLVPHSYDYPNTSPGMMSQPSTTSPSFYPNSAVVGVNRHHSVASVDPGHLPMPVSSAGLAPAESMYTVPPPQATVSTSPNLHSTSYPYSSNPIRLLSPSPRPPPQCFEHGCGGRQFSTFSNLLRHQREKSGKASKSVCPNCGGVFTRTTARNGHLRGGKCRGRQGSGGNEAARTGSVESGDDLASRRSSEMRR
ncbi:MAG: hypothetical protein Q9227_004961 [Pyrenula ochraceoflavens]